MIDIIQDGTTYRTALEEATIAIGGEGKKFVPNINSSRWNDECWVNINYPVTVGSIKESFDNNKIDLLAEGIKHSYYIINGELEYELTFETQPLDVIEFDIDYSAGLKFHLQPSIESEYYRDPHGCSS